MLSKKVVFAILIVVITALAILLSTSGEKTSEIEGGRPQTTSKEKLVDYKASFAIFTYGTFRVFSATMYHNLSPDVFIQADNSNRVHVKKSGITWNDFFNTLPFKLTKNCLTTGTGETFCSGQSGNLKFYLNGVKTANLLDLEINPGDQVLISFGNEDDVQIEKQLQQVPMIKN